MRAPLFPPYELLYNDDIRRLKFSFLENDKKYDYTCRVYTGPYMYLYNYSMGASTLSSISDIVTALLFLETFMAILYILNSIRAHNTYYI